MSELSDEELLQRFEANHRESMSLLRELSGPPSPWSAFAKILLGAKTLDAKDQARILREQLESPNLEKKDIEFDSDFIDELRLVTTNGS